jgi:hypothetical protein
MALNGDIVSSGVSTCPYGITCSRLIVHRRNLLLLERSPTLSGHEFDLSLLALTAVKTSTALRSRYTDAEFMTG